MDIKLNTSTHEFDIDSDLKMVTGQEAVAQRIKINLQFFFNEWFLDPQKGLDWFSAMDKNYNQNFIDNMIILTITEDAEVINVLEYKTSRDKATRKLNVSFKVLTIYGEFYMKEGFLV